MERSCGALLLLALVVPVNGRTEADVEDNGGGSLGLPIFLGVATLLQLAFLYRGATIVHANVSAAQRSKGVALLALAFADFLWAFACLLHCIMNYKLGRFWGGDVGCDAQGFYSTLACFSTMLFTVQITYITHLHLSQGKTAIPSTSKVALSSVGLYAFALLLSAIPFLPSVAGFSYTAEGFCFIDYYDDAINTVFFLMMLVTMGCVWYYTMLSYTALSNKQGHGQTSALGNGISNRKYAVLMFSCFFTLYYVCGFGLVFQGYLYKSYTNKLQITSGILAHGAELINPIIYGIVWCRLFLHDDDEAGEGKVLDLPAGSTAAPTATPAAVRSTRMTSLV